MVYNILLPFDSSANSIKALNFVKDLAFKLNAKVFLLSVFESPSLLLMNPYEITPDILNEIESNFKTNINNIIEKSIKELQKAGISTEVITLKGDAGLLIVETANEKECTFIVMGSRGLGKLKSLLMGSVSNYVLNHANCPVMIIKD